ncbi:MAG: orotidine-5'-phosphate decarboxylase [Desulfobulbaceae bacterium]|nr:orotidine-5'-phosphate decarboxylase [Desulfobulbaceae bacterium]MCK5436443.1 orotidine-5'-phosphate decarboxylase [Desulfobulbaceae bacterium]
MNKKNIPLNERIIFALDFSSTDEAKQWVRRVESHIKFYKVGLQLFLAGWFPIIEWIIDRGHKVMVDLKFFDVPETVKLAVEQLQNRGITFATIHGNDPIVRAAVKEKGDLKLLAVTVLTSFGENDMKEMGLQCSVEDLVFHRAKQALDIGCDGVVSSGLEAARLRERLGEKFLIITPGIRPGKNIEVKEDDQVRIMTAEKAIKNGADHVVIGRPIKTSKDPVALIKSIQKNISLL